MKKELMTLVTTVVLSIAAFGSAASAKDNKPMDFSQADMTKYATFTEIVDDINPGMGYANVNLDGTDVLLVSTGCYDWDGTDVAIDSSVFAYKDGEVAYLGQLQSGGTANPLTIRDGKIFTAGHHFVAKNTVKNGELVVAEEACEIFDNKGYATYYVDSKKVSDDTKLMQLFSQCMSGEMVPFQVVK